jgi:hypothetical protein
MVGTLTSITVPDRMGIVITELLSDSYRVSTEYRLSQVLVCDDMSSPRIEILNVALQ